MIDFNTIANILIEQITDEWVAQGHSLTGAFEQGLESRIITTSGSTKIQIIDTTEQGYGKILDDGVTASQIRYPYARARIKGLTEYAKLRLGAGDKEAISIAFAIATKHAKEGMPLPSSKRFSRTGKRTKFVEDASKRIKDILSKEIKKEIDSNGNNINNNTG